MQERSGPGSPLFGQFGAAGPSLGRILLGAALVALLGAIALPLALPPPEEGGPDLPWTPPTFQPPTSGGNQPPTNEPPPRDPPDDPPTGDWEAHLEVSARTGTLGGQPFPVDDRLRSTNIWFTNGWWPERNETWVKMLKAFEPGALRWPSGHPGQSYCWEREPGEPWPGCHGERTLPKEQFDAFVRLSRDVGAEPLIAINVKHAPPDMAAAMVRYANVEKGYDIKYWHLGNEPDLGYQDANVRTFIHDQWKRYASAMRAVDPDIKLIGPEYMTGAHVVGANGKQDWMRPFLEANKGTVDGISWHLYPLDSENPRPTSPAYPTVEHLLQWWDPAWEPSSIRFVEIATTKLRQDRDELMPGAEIWVTELGPDSGAPGAKGITDGQVAAVWFADVIGRFGEQGTDAVFQFAYDHWSAQDELSLVVRPPNGNYDPLPPWYTYWLYAQHFDGRFVQAVSSDEGNVSVSAALRPDGKLAVVLVNKAGDERTARLTLREFGRVSSADVYTLSAPSPTSLDATVNGVSVDPLRFEETTAAVKPRPGTASTDALWTLAPYTVTFVVFSPSTD